MPYPASSPRVPILADLRYLAHAPLTVEEVEDDDGSDFFFALRRLVGPAHRPGVRYLLLLPALLCACVGAYRSLVVWDASLGAPRSGRENLRDAVRSVPLGGAWRGAAWG